MTRRGSVPGVLVASVVALLVAGCTGQGGAAPPRASSPSATVPGADGGSSANRGPVAPTSVVAPECEPRAGVVVEQLPDVVVPAVVVAAQRTPDSVVDGEKVPGVDLPGFSVPAQLVDAGCVIRYVAPGGCLGAVEVTGARVEGVTIPRSVLPAVVMPGGEVLQERVFTSVSLPAVSTAAVRTDQICQVEVDGELATVSRSGVVRDAAAREGLARPGGGRPRACGDDGCVAEVRVEAVRLEPVRLPSVDVDPGRLESRKLAGSDAVDVVSGGAATSYVTSGDVLFDSGQAVLREDAARSLQAVGAELAAGSPVVVEGHTDDVGSDADNLVLSQRRAQAVADRLVADGAVEVGDLVVLGLGEGVPAFSNDSEERRAGNRRVVVTVVDGE